MKIKRLQELKEEAIAKFRAELLEEYKQNPDVQAMADRHGTKRGAIYMHLRSAEGYETRPYTRNGEGKDE